jgi:hypothetical protein
MDHRGQLVQKVEMEIRRAWKGPESGRTTLSVARGVVARSVARFWRGKGMRQTMGRAQRRNARMPTDDVTEAQRLPPCREQHPAAESAERH